MSQIIQTEAIVLRSIKFSETSKIVTLYTKELGKIGAIAKGVRKKEGKQGSVFEPMSIVQVVLYMKEGRDVQTIGQFEQSKSFHHLASDLEQISVGLSLVEILNSIVHEQEQHTEMYLLLKECLLAVDRFSPDPSCVLYYFELKAAELFGFAPVFDVCSNCNKAIGETGESPWQMYNIKKGSPVCDDCPSVQQGITRISTAGMQTMQKLLKCSTVSDTVNIKSQFSIEIEDFLTKYLQSHISGFRLPRARTMFKHGN